jgi:hypothetical protein
VATDGRLLPLLSEDESPRRNAARVFKSSWSGRSSYAVAPVTAGCRNRFIDDGGNSDSDDDEAIAVVVVVDDDKVVGVVDCVVVFVSSAADDNGVEAVIGVEEILGEGVEEEDEAKSSSHSMSSVGRRGESLNDNEDNGDGALLLLSAIFLTLLLQM